MKKKSKLSRKLSKIVRDAVSENLETYDMHKWKAVCKGFGPIHYVSSTRRMWLEKNQYRVEGAREIVEFMDKWMTHFRNMDEFENYLGPGHDLSVRIALPGIKWEQLGRIVQLEDHLDGSYSGRVELTGEEVQRDARLIFAVDGNIFTSADQLPVFGRRSLSIHTGAAIPAGSMKDDFERGLNFLVDLDYHLTPLLSVVGYLGYNNFKSKTAGVDDAYWINISANLKYMLKTAPLYLLPRHRLPQIC